MTSSLSFRSYGQGLPILFIHGWELNGDVDAYDFEPLFNQNGFRRIYVDLPGMGKTPIGGAQNLDDMLTKIEEFVGQEIGSGRFLIVGSSCGAYLACALAERHAPRIDGVLLRVPMVQPDNEDRDTDPFRALISDAKVTSGIAKTEQDSLGDILIEQDKYVEELRKKTKIYSSAEEKCDRKALQQIRDDATRYRLSSGLPKSVLSSPVLILCGRQDTVVGFRDALRLVQQYPRATFAVLDRSTHAMPLLEKDLFRALVNDWLERVQQWRDVR